MTEEVFALYDLPTTARIQLLGGSADGLLLQARCDRRGLPAEHWVVATTAPDVTAMLAGAREPEVVPSLNLLYRRSHYSEDQRIWIYELVGRA